MTHHHCPRSNWTGPESELVGGICPECAVTTLYEDCEVRAIEAPAFPLGVSVRGPGSWMLGRTAQEIDEINAAAEAAGCTPEEVIVRRSKTLVILTHAPGCTYPSGGKRCTCPWTEEQLNELVRGARTETDRAMWAALLREVRK